MYTCPICDKNNDNKMVLCEVSFTYNSKFDLCECPNCGVIHIDPLPTEQQFIDFYSIWDYEFDRWKQEERAKEYLGKLAKFNRNGGKFLDVGCASGYLVNGVANYSDWEAYGVELSEKPVQFAREVLGLENVVQGDLNSAAYPDAFFDCVNINDVLEHVPDPMAFLHECRRILKPGGIIFLGVPNGYNDSRGLLRYYNTYNEPGSHASGHIFFYQKQTFDYMFNKVGLKVNKVETLAIKNGLRNIGILPKKSRWMDFYKPRDAREVVHEGEIELIDKKKFPDFYYWYRYKKHTLFAINGIHNFGQDLNFILETS